MNTEDVIDFLLTFRDGDSGILPANMRRFIDGPVRQYRLGARFALSKQQFGYTHVVYNFVRFALGETNAPTPAPKQSEAKTGTGRKGSGTGKAKKHGTRVQRVGKQLH